jgi:hypothetical protein
MLGPLKNSIDKVFNNFIENLKKTIKNKEVINKKNKEKL